MPAHETMSEIRILQRLDVQSGPRPGPAGKINMLKPVHRGIVKIAGLFDPDVHRHSTFQDAVERSGSGPRRLSTMRRADRRTRGAARLAPPFVAPDW